MANATNQSNQHWLKRLCRKVVVIVMLYATAFVILWPLQRPRPDLVVKLNDHHAPLVGPEVITAAAVSPDGEWILAATAGARKNENFGNDARYPGRMIVARTKSDTTTLTSPDGRSSANYTNARYKSVIGRGHLSDLVIWNGQGSQWYEFIGFRAGSTIRPDFGRTISFPANVIYGGVSNKVFLSNDGREVVFPSSVSPGAIESNHNWWPLISADGRAFFFTAVRRFSNNESPPTPPEDSEVIKVHDCFVERTKFGEGSIPVRQISLYGESSQADREHKRYPEVDCFTISKSGNRVAYMVNIIGQSTRDRIACQGIRVVDTPTGDELCDVKIRESEYSPRWMCRNPKMRFDEKDENKVYVWSEELINEPRRPGWTYLGTYRGEDKPDFDAGELLQIDIQTGEQRILPVKGDVLGVWEDNVVVKYQENSVQVWNTENETDNGVRFDCDELLCSEEHFVVGRKLNPLREWWRFDRWVSTQLNLNFWNDQSINWVDLRSGEMGIPLGVDSNQSFVALVPNQRVAVFRAAAGLQEGQFEYYSAPQWYDRTLPWISALKLLPFMVLGLLFFRLLFPEA